jgi:hypothetical protein
MKQHPLQHYMRNQAIFTALVLGLVSFFLVVGPTRLQVTNSEWLFSGGWGDTWSHYIGWKHFRQSPWGLPLGANPSNGIELASSIVYSDSIPIAALLFKALSPILPITFQYFGLWILLSFTLQAYFSLRIYSLFFDSRLVQAIGALILVFSPILIHRTNVHVSLTSHWLILASLFLAMRKNFTKDFTAWLILLIVSAGIHPYFLVINFFVFLFTLVLNLVSEKRVRILSLSKVLGLASIPLVLWLYGYFEISLSSQTTEFPYELFRVDMLQPFNFAGWSHLASIGNITELQGNYDAFNYLGPAILVLLGFFLVNLVGDRISVGDSILRNVHLVVPVTLMALYSLTNKISIGRRQIISFAVPEWFEPLTTSLRAAGRFFWPMYYLLSIYVVVYFYRKIKNKKVRVYLLTIVLVFHIADTNYAWRSISNLQYGNLNEQGLSLEYYQRSAWASVLENKSNIIVLPITAPGYQWKIVGTLASDFGLATNSVYLARQDTFVMKKVNDKYLSELEDGRLNEFSTYIVTPEFKQELINRNLLSIDRFYELDGLTLIRD